MIAFAQSFPNGVPSRPAPKPWRNLVESRWLDAGQRLALLGAGLLGIGVFLPFVRFGPLPSPSLWQQEGPDGLRLGVVGLVLGLLAAVLAVRRSYLLLWPLGITAYLALAVAFLLGVHRTWQTDPGAGDSFDFDVGWCVLVLGIVLVIIGALVDGLLDSKREAWQRTARLYGEWRRDQFGWFAQFHRGGCVRDG